MVLSQFETHHTDSPKTLLVRIHSHFGWALSPHVQSGGKGQELVQETCWRHGCTLHYIFQRNLNPFLTFHAVAVSSSPCGGQRWRMWRSCQNVGRGPLPGFLHGRNSNVPKSNDEMMKKMTRVQNANGVCNFVSIIIFGVSDLLVFRAFPCTWPRQNIRRNMSNCCWKLNQKNKFSVR